MKDKFESEIERPSYIIAITGASGAIFGFSLLKALADRSRFIYLIISKPGFKVIKDELGMFADIDTSKDLNSLNSKIKDEIKDKFGIHSDEFAFLDDMFLEARIASGSAKDIKGMIVIPCSMGSLSRIACRNSGNLIERACDVMLKERNKLIVCPRETPFNDIHLKNMLSLARSGAIILPPIPAFYSKPQSVGDIIDFIIGKILDSLSVENDVYIRWKGYDWQK